MSFHSTKFIAKGRKDHRCEHCRQTIEKGAPSVVVSGVVDGDFFSMRSHPECDALWQAVYRQICDWGEGMDPDTLEALEVGARDARRVLEGYAEDYPLAVEHLMITVRKWEDQEAFDECDV